MTWQELLQGQLNKAIEPSERSSWTTGKAASVTLSPERWQTRQDTTRQQHKEYRNDDVTNINKQVLPSPHLLVLALHLSACVARSKLEPGTLREWRQGKACLSISCLAK